MLPDNDTTWKLQCTVNGHAVAVEVPQDETLLTTLRERLGLTGSKGSCLEGECGSCTVIVDGKAVNSCLVLSPQMQGSTIETIEGLASGDKLSILQRKFLVHGLRNSAGDFGSLSSLLEDPTFSLPVPVVLSG